MDIAEELRLPWPGVIERVVDFLANEKLVDLRGGKGFGRASVEFVLTEKGREYARDALTPHHLRGPRPRAHRAVQRAHHRADARRTPSSAGRSC